MRNIPEDSIRYTSKNLGEHSTSVENEFSTSDGLAYTRELRNETVLQPSLSLAGNIPF